jgi:hypothetical protein
MLKKIALAGIFAVASIISFKPATVNAKPTTPTTTVGAPVMHGLCGCLRC